MAAWKHEQLRISNARGVIETVDGWTYNNLGIVGPPTGDWLFGHWLIIHLNSGHAIARIQRGTLLGMQDMTAEIADAGDWSFEGLAGWKNQFPDAPERTAEIVERHRPDLRRRPSAPPSPVNASAIARLREDDAHPSARKDRA